MIIDIDAPTLHTYCISAHGGTDWHHKTKVPSKCEVVFHQKFGKEMMNRVGKLLQTALANIHLEKSKDILRAYKTTALWVNGKDETQEYEPHIMLHADNVDFYSGIVNCDTNKVVYNLKNTQIISLGYALEFIRKLHKKEDIIKVHCLFCL